MTAAPSPSVGTASPATAHTGGFAVSVSYLRDWHECRRKFFWRYVFEWPSGDRGAEPRFTGAPLLIGSAFHAGVAAWRLSGWASGTYDRDAAMTAVRASFLARAPEFESEDEYAKALAETEDLMLRYTAKWANEYPDVRVHVLPDGRPAIEELFEIPLGNTPYVMNVRPDAVVVAHGFLAANECKTAAPSRARTTLSAMEVSPQTLAETYILRTLGLPVVGVYIDLAVKGNTRSVEKFQRVLITADEELVDAFPALVMEALADIGEATALPGPLDTQLARFPMTGMFAGACERCSFRSLCWNPGSEAATLGAFRPRTRTPQPTTEEVTE
jgi:hypothetical protein